MKLSKCHFSAKEIQYLGHILGMEGIKPVPAKTEAIKAMHLPVNPKQVRTFLGLVGYYQKFIKNFAKIAKPLTMLTCMDVKFEWKETHHCAFMKPKDTIRVATFRFRLNSLCFPCIFPVFTAIFPVFFST